MIYERRYSQWREDASKISFMLVLNGSSGIEVGSELVELTKPYTSAQMLVAIRAAVRSIEAQPEGAGEELLRRVLAMENGV